jgi:DNA-binding MarR family transcriptional regulator
LVSEGWVERLNDPSDRRALIVRITPAGQAWFDRMAVEHEKWLLQLLGGLNGREMAQLYELLGRLRKGIAASPE